ncbi:MAG: helix-turn-helix transcriptional regulator [Alphaproteobacteria bacterium]|nr:helix-turn-helix transcriptional regulator [Alphaproteobacteria bacterium]
MRTHTNENPKPRAGSRPVTRAEYNALLARMEDIEDSLTLLRAQEEGKSADAWPQALVGHMLAGEHPLRLWREHRGLTLDALSRAAGVAAGYLSEIESGKKPGSVASLKKCALALNVHLDDLVHMAPPRALARPAKKSS